MSESTSNDLQKVPSSNCDTVHNSTFSCKERRRSIFNLLPSTFNLQSSSVYKLDPESFSPRCSTSSAKTAAAPEQSQRLVVLAPSISFLGQYCRALIDLSIWRPLTAIRRADGAEKISYLILITDVIPSQTDATFTVVLHHSFQQVWR